MSSTQGTIYLLHFSRPYKHARHYIGYTQDMEQRMAAHASGRGARLIEVVSDNGITFEVARTWSGDRKEERRIKNMGGASRLCPMCRETKRASSN